MEKITAYKHETGKIFTDISAYHSFDRGYKRNQQLLKVQQNRKQLSKEANRLQSEIFELEEAEEKRVAKRDAYVREKVRPILNSVDDMKLQIQKLRKAITITNASIKNHKLEFEKEFNEMHPTNAKKIGPLQNKLSGLTYKIRMDEYRKY